MEKNAVLVKSFNDIPVASVLDTAFRGFWDANEMPR